MAKFGYPSGVSSVIFHYQQEGDRSDETLGMGECSGDSDCSHLTGCVENEDGAGCVYRVGSCEGYGNNAYCHSPSVQSCECPAPETETTTGF